jgi:hypothetical protein
MSLNRLDGKVILVEPRPISRRLLTKQLNLGYFPQKNSEAESGPKGLEGSALNLLHLKSMFLQFLLGPTN